MLKYQSGWLMIGTSHLGCFRFKLYIDSERLAKSFSRSKEIVSIAWRLIQCFGGWQLFFALTRIIEQGLQTSLPHVFPVRLGFYHLETPSISGGVDLVSPPKRPRNLRKRPITTMDVDMMLDKILKKSYRKYEISQLCRTLGWCSSVPMHSNFCWSSNMLKIYAWIDLEASNSTECWGILCHSMWY